MKIKLVKMPRPTQIDMVVRTPSGAKEFTLGQTIELSEDEAKQVLASQFGSCFVVVSSEEPAPKAATKVMGHSKASRKTPAPDKIEEDALEEATKMVGDYDIK